MSAMNLFTRPAKEHSLSRDYLNEVDHLAKSLEFLEVVLPQRIFADPQRANCKIAVFTKLSESDSATLLGILSQLAVPLLLKKLKTYEAYFSTKSANTPGVPDANANICGANAFLRRQLAEKIAVLHESAKSKSDPVKAGSISIKIFPRKLLAAVQAIHAIISPERTSLIKPEDYPEVITFQALNAEQYKHICDRYREITNET